MRLLVALGLSMTLYSPLMGQSNGSDTIPVAPGIVGAGAHAMQECRHLPLKVHSLARFLRAGGSSLSQILQDSTQAGRLDVVLQDTTTRDVWGSYAPNGNQSANCTLWTGASDQGSGGVLTAPSYSSAYTLITMRNDTSLVMSHLYVRSMNDDGTGVTQGANIRFTSGQKGVLYQSSTAGADDKEIAYTDIQNTTVQNVMVRGHHTTTTTCVNSQSTATNHTTYRTAYIRCKKRVPRLNSQNIADDWQFVNWLAYEWKGDSRQIPTNPTDSITRADFVSSYMKPGPGTDNSKEARVLSGEWHNSYSQNGGHPQVYDQDMIHSGATTITAYTSNPISNVPNDVEWTVDSSGVASKDSLFVTSPSAIITTSWPIRDTASALDMVNMADSLGRVTRLNCKGQWQWMGQDSIDAHASTGFQDSTQVSDFTESFPANLLSPAAGCADSDADGLPDEFETVVGGSATSVAPDSITASGYLMIEHFLWGLQAPNFLDTDTAVYVDSTFSAILRDCGNNWNACTPSITAPPVLPTFGTGKMVYLDSMILDTVFYSGIDTASQAPTDTIIYRYEAIPTNGSDGIACGGFAAQNYRFLFATSDTLAPQAMDSVAVADTLANWGLRGMCASADSLKARIPDQNDAETPWVLFPFAWYRRRRGR